MTDSTRMIAINALLKLVLRSIPHSEEWMKASQDLTALNVLPEEWLLLAEKEEPLPPNLDFSRILAMPDEEKEASEAENNPTEEEEEEAAEEEEASEAAEEEDHRCFRCGLECTPYEMDGEIYWICEGCYSGTSARVFGTCDFICGGEGHYDGNDEI